MEREPHSVLIQRLCHLIHSTHVIRRLTLEALRRVIRHVSQDPAQVNLFTLDIDGSDQALPSLGTLAELSPFTNAPRPSLIACTFTNDQTLMASSLVAAIHHGAVEEGLRHSCKLSTNHAVCGLYTTPSLPAYVRRRLASITHASSCSWEWALQLATEAATHFTFLLSTLLLIGTPIHESYGRGSYCSAYRELMKCQYGAVRGFHHQRIFPALLGAAYSGMLCMDGWSPPLFSSSVLDALCFRTFPYPLYLFPYLFSSCPFRCVLDAVSSIRWRHHSYDYPDVPSFSLHASHGSDRWSPPYNRTC